MENNEKEKKEDIKGKNEEEPNKDGKTKKMKDGTGNVKSKIENKELNQRINLVESKDDKGNLKSPKIINEDSGNGNQVVCLP